MKIVFTILITLVLCGCVRGAANAPGDTVVDNANLVIYHVQKCDDVRLGTWIYWVRDNSTKGWTFISDKEYKVGDRLTIQVAPK